MISVQLQPFEGGMLVSIGCACGANMMTDNKTKVTDLNHAATFGGADIELNCNDCDRQFLIHPERDRIRAREVI